MMYETKNMKVGHETNNTIHVEHKQLMPKFNAYAGGYGAHEKSKKARHKSDRRANKKLCYAMD